MNKLLPWIEKLSLVVYLLVSIVIFLFIFKSTKNSFWFVFPFLLISVIRTDISAVKSAFHILLIVFIILCAIVFFNSANIILSGLTLFAIVFYIETLKTKYSYHTLYFVYINILLICIFSLSPVTFAQLILLTLAGIIAILLQLFLIPILNYLAIKTTVQKAVVALINLNDTFFSTLLNQEYKDQLYLYEHRFNKMKLKALRILLFNRKFLGKKNAIKIYNNNEKLINIYSIILDYSQIRLRISDHTTFDLCRDELNAINKCINETLLAWMQEKNIGERLNEAIEQLENTYYHVLQVAAPEPLAFLVFINSLKECLYATTNQ